MSAHAFSPTEQATLPYRVLVIEDHPDGRESLRVLLGLWGYQVEVASDGLLGVEKALSWRPDAAIVDINLPLLDGHEAARRIRAQLGGEVVLVALTAYGQIEDRERALKAGFDIHLTKPVEVDRLQSLLAACRQRM